MNLENAKRLTKDIVVYENFLTKEECDAIINVLEKQVSLDKLSWTPITFYESYSSVLPQDNDDELFEYGLSATFFSDLLHKMQESVKLVHGDKSIYKIGLHAQKWEPGAYAKEHSDNTNMDGTDSPFERSRFAAFIYLNDDFEGGNLIFNKQNCSISPKTGMLATFAGGFDNTHEVELIKSGIRYTIGSFWDNKDESEYSDELKDLWAAEMKSIREDQEKIKSEWQDSLKEGYKIDENGNKYKWEGK